MNRRRIGLAAALVLALVVVVAVAAWPGEKPRTIVAQFASGAGLYEGNKVTVLGITVGRIVTIEPRGTAVDITLEVDPEVPVPVDVQAVAVSSSVLTDRHIELSPAYTGGPTLSDNAFLPVDRTRTPIEFDRLLSMVDTLSRELGGDGGGEGPVGEMLAVTADSLEGNVPAMREALGRLSDALRTGEDPSATRDSIVTLVDNLNALTQAAADNDATIREFGGSLRRLSDMLADEALGQGDTGSKLNEILTRTEEMLAQNRIPIQGTVASTETLTRAMSDYEREMSEFLNVAPLLLDNAYNAIDRTNGVVRVHTFADRILFDHQMLKEVCNLAGLQELGCATGKPQDFGPDFGITAMLATVAGVVP